MTGDKRNYDRRRFAAGLAASAASGMLLQPALALAPLGTHRVLAVSAHAFPRFGSKTYPASLPLADGEVILTFDDGPFPATTAPILDALSREQVRATFFLIGRNARENPEMVRRIASLGHSIGNHSMNHRWLDKLSHEAALREITEGEEAIRQALGRPIAPFFRFPGFLHTPALLDELAKRANSVWGADIWASDWTPMTPEQQLQLVMTRLKQRRRGIILFHDIKAQTAQMLPGFLRALKDGGYRVVHAVG